MHIPIRQLLLLLCTFAYFLTIGLKQLRPHWSDFIQMETSTWQQMKLLLYNKGWMQPPLYDLSPLHNYKVAIVGMVKNAEQTLPSLLQQLDTLSCAFAYSHFFILESNSLDSTPDIIYDWSLKPMDCNLYSNANANANAQTEKTLYQPLHEFAEIMEIMLKYQSLKSRKIREEKYVIYRNFLLNNIQKWYSQFKEKNGKWEIIDYLVWIDMDLTGFDLQQFANELPIAANLGYDVICSNGIKYSGWYYDSYASVLSDNKWAHGIPRFEISNRLNRYRFYDMRSCFGGMAVYRLDFLLQSQCRYQSFDAAIANNPHFASFVAMYSLTKSCEHLPLNFCLYQNGAQLAVATRLHTFYGTVEAHGA